MKIQEFLIKLKEVVKNKEKVSEKDWSAIIKVFNTLIPSIIIMSCIEVDVKKTLKNMEEYFNEKI